MSKIHKALQKAEQEGLGPAGGFGMPPGLVVEVPRAGADKVQPRTLDDSRFPLVSLTAEARECLQVPPTAADGFHTLQNRLDLQPPATRPRCLLVTSALPEEGCSVVSLGLAASFVRREGRSVLLVDGDARRPNLDRFFDLNGRPGLLQVLGGAASAEDAIHRTDQEGLYVLAAGRTQAAEGQLDLLNDAPRLRGFSSFLKGHFGYVVVDASPVLSNSDVQVMASAADGVILVVQAHRTRRHVVQQAKKVLDRSGAKVIGVILNRRRYPIPGWLYRSI